jgi:hypothetical protein
MIAQCPACSRKVVVKEDGACPHCRNVISGYETKGAPEKEKSAMPLRVIFAIIMYSLVILLFLGITLQYNFDILSFLLVLASALSIVGIVSIVSKRRWARKYNIALQLSLCLLSLSISVFLAAIGFMAWPGIFVVFLALLFQGWVTFGFMRDRRIIVFLRHKRAGE